MKPRFALLSFTSVSIVVLCACKPDTQNSIDDALAANMTAPYDYYMNNMRTTRFTAEGQLAYRLNATRITHFPEGDHAVLDHPDLFWQGEDEKSWRLTSLTGDLRKAIATGEDELLLQGDVQLASELQPGQPVLMKTETLTVQTVSRTASTQAPVSMDAEGISLQGIGMEMRLADNYIKLLNEVRGAYEP